MLMKKGIYAIFFFLLSLGVSRFCYGQPLEENLSSSILYDKQGENLIGYLHLGKEEPIQESTYLYVKFALEAFRAQGASFVLLDIDSPGGGVFAALKISQELKKLDSQFHIPVVAFIDNWALSAGALIAYSCRFIGITTDASMGAAEPVIASSDGKMETASEKINSALRAEFSNTARFFGRDPLIAEAMVDKDILLVKRKGKVIRLESEKDLILSGKNPDQIITRKGKLLTLDSKEMIDLGVADFAVAYQTLSPITEKEKEEGRWSFSKHLLSSQPFFHGITNPVLIDYQNSKIGFFSFLAHPLVSSLLMMGLIIGIYAEVSHPGFGFFGITALVCLSLILLSSFAIHTIAWLECIALIIGVVLLVIELFLLPGFGWTGFTGILFVLGALSAMILPHASGVSYSFGEWTLSTIELVDRLGYFIGSILLSILIMYLLTRWVLKKSPFASHLVLKGEMNQDEGFVAGPSKELLPAPLSEGIAYCPLRPSGKVVIHGRLMDAQAQSGFIEKGSPIIVAYLEGGKIFVRLKKGDSLR